MTARIGLFPRLRGPRARLQGSRASSATGRRAQSPGSHRLLGGRHRDGRGPLRARDRVPRALHRGVGEPRPGRDGTRQLRPGEEGLREGARPEREPPHAASGPRPARGPDERRGDHRRGTTTARRSRSTQGSRQPARTSGACCCRAERSTTPASSISASRRWLRRPWRAGRRLDGVAPPSRSGRRRGRSWLGRRLGLRLGASRSSCSWSALGSSCDDLGRSRRPKKRSWLLSPALPRRTPADARRGPSSRSRASGRASSGEAAPVPRTKPCARTGTTRSRSTR